MKRQNMPGWLASYPLLKNNQTTANQLQECLQRVMSPVCLGYSSCYNGMGCGAASGLGFAEVMGAWMWGYRLELQVPLGSLASNQSQGSIIRCHAWAQQGSPAGVSYNCRGEKGLLDASLHYQVDFCMNPGCAALDGSRNALWGSN